MTSKTQNQYLHDGTVNFVSWNIKGLNHELKRKKVLSHLTGLNAKIVFLQETHLLSKDQFRLQKDWAGQMFHSSFTKKTRGVGILIHRTVSLLLKSLCPTHSPHRWRLNPLLLVDENCTEFISKQISFFLETNTSSEVSAGILWETLKAFLRGQIISYLSHRNKLETKKVSELKSKITRIDEEHARLPSEALHRKRQALHSELNLLTTKEIEQLIYKSRHHYYEHGENANKLLAQQIHKQEVRNAIPVITNMNRDKIIDHKNIMHTFRDYYKSLYSTEFKEDNTQCNVFLDTLQLPQTDTFSVEELGKPLVLSELLDAIKSLQGGKAAGPDCYSAEFYKKFSTQLAPLLLAIFTEARDNKILPQTFRQALITIFLKQNKDLLQCASYRPISLLNNDVKIFSKIIARRMEKMLPSVISQDQSGFIKVRHLSSNLRHLFNVIYSPTKSNTPEILLSLDAEKAFDMIEWKYLFTTLEKFGFRQNICAWIKLLYTIQKFQFNMVPDKDAPCHHCYLQSPLNHWQLMLMINGIIREGLEQKISLYADDMVLYISYPQNSVPAVLTALTEFQKISGLRINLNKSVLFPVNSQFKYLGVNITSKRKALYQRNFAVCMEKVKQDLHRWSTLHLTLAGRFNVVKMNILPKLLFLFENIPIYINKSFFKQLDSTITSFIWNSKHPRIQRATLQRPKAEGGMALPNFQFYYWAANLLINISEWEWKVAMQRLHSSSICTKHTIIQLKIIYRVHLSRLKLSKMFPGQDPTCEHCNQVPASLGHMFWACAKLTSF
uniref:Reverse transcriptase domain-containing protein n=1 Tax=Erpetoichthys calabaricus TaxID=27687 RepID=A0A8C4X2W1_ERPCA